MLASHYFLTLRQTADGPRAFVSPAPEFDYAYAAGKNGFTVGTKSGETGVRSDGSELRNYKSGPEKLELWFWDRPYPLWLAETILDELTKLIRARERPSLRLLARKISGLVRRQGWSGEGQWRRVTGKGFLNLPEEAASDEFFLRVLPGRSLTLREISSRLSSIGIHLPVRALEYLLHKEVLAGRVKRTAGVGPDATGRFSCRRCGEKEMVHEEFVTDSPHPCFICEACRSLGAVTSNTPLYTWTAPLSGTSPLRQVPLILPKLTRWQETAAREILEFWRKKEARSLLVWAVCGAGKTEVVFPAIRQALADGKRVLITVPRREIARDLGFRAEKAFPGLALAILYGGKKKEVPGARLVVATTHQLLRFTPAFHLAILDEADAYPFRENRMLAAALAGALLPEGKMIYMTATPGAEWRRKALRGEIALTRLPLRHHGHPLPVPTLIRLKLPSLEENDDWPVPALVTGFLHRVAAKDGKALVFLPTINLVRRVGEALKTCGEVINCPVEYLHSRDPLRDDKLKRFSTGRASVLVTTTLLERGLTFPHLDVLVLYADDNRVFSTETLVQIAGRVGRSAKSPGGEILMAGRGISREMRLAKVWIKQMNREARRSGFLS